MGGWKEDREWPFEGGEAGADGSRVGLDDGPDCGGDDAPAGIRGAGRGGKCSGADDCCCADAGASRAHLVMHIFRS